MSDPQTVNIGLSVPTRGSDIGTWDLPVNGDFTALDGLFGGVQTISVSSAPVTLTSPAGFTPTPSAGPTQAQNAVLRFTGVLTGNVAVTLPLPGYYIVENLTTGAFLLVIRIANGQQICIDNGMCQHVYNDGTNIRFVNLPPVGSYLDTIDTAAPAWITACTVPPYLNCDGSTFSAVTYPYLNAKLGGNVLPDFRGRSGFYLNQGTGRLTSGGAGINGNTIFSAGGNNGLTASLLPVITSANASQAISVTSASGQIWQGVNGSIISGGGNNYFATIAGLVSTGNNSISVTSNNTSGNSVGPNAAPGIVSGIRLIRAA